MICSLEKENCSGPLAASSRLPEQYLKLRRAILSRTKCALSAED